MKPLPLKEKEYRSNLLRTERRAIIPIKWFVWFVSAGLWLTLQRQPSAGVLSLFFVYLVFNIFETWLFYFHGVGLKLVRRITLISYLIDVVYVTMLVFFELGTYYPGDVIQSNFYILYFLLVFRGFALFSTWIETLLINTLISALFILTLYLQFRGMSFVIRPEFLIQLVLIWLVVLMAWIIMVVLNQQKMDLIGASEEIGRQENLARIGELAAGIAHEINNPLGIIIASAEYITKSSDPNDPHREEVESIYRESIRCREIMQQMLAFARPKPPEASQIDIATLTDEVLQFVFPNGRADGIELVREYETQLGPYHGDLNQVKQALLNLFLNAKQAIPRGERGRIISRLYHHRHPECLRIEVEDNGTGIAREDFEHVFDPFFTRKSRGTGLGLAVTQRIVENLGGSIFLDMVQPHGTRVRIELPMEQPKKTSPPTFS